MLQHTIDKWLSPHGGLLLNEGITNEVAAPPHSPKINGEVHPAKHSSESPDLRLTSPALPRNPRALPMEILMNGHGNLGGSLSALHQVYIMPGHKKVQQVVTSMSEMKGSSHVMSIWTLVLHQP